MMKVICTTAPHLLRRAANYFVFFAIVMSAHSISAAQVTLVWDAPDASIPAGYRVYYGTASRDYARNKDAGSITQCTVTGLEEGKTYYFSATAYYPDGSESGFSNEASKHIPITGDDLDGDGLLDSDGDGLSDVEEMNVTDTDPQNPDTDGDGLDDGVEVTLYGTNPNRLDTDSDGIHDGTELEFWGGDWDADHDQDGLINLLDDDSDGNGVSDGIDSDLLYCPTYGFDQNSEGFAYGDDLFRGTTSPAYASGDYVPFEGYSGGGLSVTLGGPDFRNITTGMSGGWRTTFEVGDWRTVSISLKYRLTMAGEYEPDEYSQVLAAVDGKLIGTTDKDYLLMFHGTDGNTPMQDSGWRTATLTMNLAPGVHTLTVGVLNSKKTGPLEITQAYFDEITINFW